MSAEISFPIRKACTALAAGVSTSALSMTQEVQSFLPTSLGEWLAAGASGVALIYSLHLMGEWYWKKFWRDVLERRGWIKPLPPEKKKRRRADEHE